jgi:hypothetical protein
LLSFEDIVVMVRSIVCGKKRAWLATFPSPAPVKLSLLFGIPAMSHHSLRNKDGSDHTRFEEIVAPSVERSSGAEHHTVVMETFANA